MDTGSHSYTESLPSSRSSSYSLDEISQSSGLHPPSAKDLYMHRKDYADSINNQMTISQFRVEHLFTCTLDGVQVSNLQDCVERLQLLAATDRVWGQAMVLELDDQNLLLKDKESEEELDCLSISHVSEISSVMDGDIYDSLLLISVKEQQRSNVFMFQCDSVRADYIKRDLERFLQNNKNTNNSRGLYSVVVKERKKSPPPPERREQTQTQPHPEEQSISDYDESPVQTPTSRQEPPLFIDDTPFLPIQEPVSSRAPYSERERNVDILNHLINDIEEFSEVLAAVPKTEKKKKKKKKQKAVQSLPSAEEFTVCLQKFKMSFNLLAVLNNQIKAPSAAELTHCLFNILEVVVSRCPEGLPTTIVAPLLEPECVRFLSEEATKEEDELWQSLGDAWNIPSTQWPEDDEDIPIFTPVFNDGWTPPEISTQPTKPINRHNSQQSNRSQISSISWQIPQSPDISEESPVSCMRVLHDFRGRNKRELSVMKGEVLELLDISKRWWKVRNEQGEEGFVPNNVLKSTENDDTQVVESNPTLNRKSKPEEVRAWLEHQGFSQITVRCLGGLSGAMLLGMKQDELKIVCPEEGRRVYYQLQNVKSALTLASEVRPLE